MEPIVQEDPTGCGIASVATVAGESYAKVKKVALSLQIDVTDPKLWSDTCHVRTLLGFFGIKHSSVERPFTSWSELPDCALMAIKWHKGKGGIAWHWVVFLRKDAEISVIDPKKSLRTNRRTDFGRIKPKWYIAISNGPHDR